MFYTFLVLLSVVFLALQFSVNKGYQKRFGAGITVSLCFTSLSGILTAFLFFCINGFSLRSTPVSLLYAAAIAVLCLSYNLIGFRIFALGSLSVYTLFLMLGGMILPYFYGVFALDEPATVPRIIGLLILILSLFFPLLDARQNGSKKTIVPFFALCILVFFLNGGVSILSKAHQSAASADTIVGTSDFVILTNGINGVLSAVSLGIVTFVKRSSAGFAGVNSPERSAMEKKPLSGIRHVLLLALAGAVCNGTSYYLQLIGAAHIDASMLYPIVTGGSVVLSALAGILFFHEIPPKWTRIGLAVTFTATLFFLF